MLKWIETTGRSEEDAIAAALFQLGLDRDDVSVEVIERAKSGFLGFGGNPARVKVSYEVPDETPAPAPVPEKKEEVKPKAEPKPVTKPAPKAEKKEPAPVKEEVVLLAAPKKPAAPKMEAKPKAEPKPVSKPAPKAEVKEQAKLQPEDEVIIAQEPASADDARAQRIREFLTGLMEHMNVQAAPEINVTPEGNYKVVLQGQGLGAIIGRRGETLDAIQQLTNYAVNHGQSKRVRIHIDAENYRAKREESLQRLAVKVAGKVVKYRKSVTLEAMNAYERHVIHTALQDYRGVTTYSTGTEPNRRTVVAYDPSKR